MLLPTLEVRRGRIVACWQRMDSGHPENATRLAEQCDIGNSYITVADRKEMIVLLFACYLVLVVSVHTRVATRMATSSNV